MATLVAFACLLQASAEDDVLDVLDRLLTDLLARVAPSIAVNCGRCIAKVRRINSVRSVWS
jgi:hypothetical protein